VYRIFKVLHTHESRNAQNLRDRADADLDQLPEAAHDGEGFDHEHLRVRSGAQAGAAGEGEGRGDGGGNLRGRAVRAGGEDRRGDGARARHLRGGVRIAVETASEAAGSSAELRYLHPDHLGSVGVVTNESGAVVDLLSFGAFRERRVAQGTTTWQGSALSLS